ncbi:MAG: hypothetical protein LAO07_11510 [Acidobacteriia bacterium]|nr:hypothetical protein [Terriglobia bacterium]
MEGLNTLQEAIIHFADYDNCHALMIQLRWPDGKVKGEAFYPPFVSAMREISYQGYLGYELCHPLPKVSGQTVGIEYADQCAQLAQEFMRGLINA